MIRCTHICNAPLVEIAGRWYHQDGQTVHDAEAGVSSIEAAQARIAELEERITTQALQIAAFEAQAQEAMRGWREAVARLSAQRPLVEAARKWAAAHTWDDIGDCEACGDLYEAARAYRAAQEAPDGAHPR
jgi:uncharacterized coiled-coil protein SlyX